MVLGIYPYYNYTLPLLCLWHSLSYLLSLSLLSHQMVQWFLDSKHMLGQRQLTSLGQCYLVHGLSLPTLGHRWQSTLGYHWHRWLFYFFFDIRVYLINFREDGVFSAVTKQFSRSMGHNSLIPVQSVDESQDIDLLRVVVKRTKRQYLHWQKASFDPYKIQVSLSQLSLLQVHQTNTIQKFVLCHIKGIIYSQLFTCSYLKTL